MVSVDFNVPAKMRDGTTLRANVYRPAAEGRWPVLLTRTPYGKDLPGALTVLDPVQAARHGYTVVVQDTRGRFASEGEWQPFEHEWNDGADTAAWAAGLPYADGQVGTYGISYHGFTQWAAAIAGGSAVKAMSPGFTWRDAFNGQAFRGGALELGLSAGWALLTGMNAVLRQHRNDPRALVLALHALVRDYDALAAAGYAELPLSALAARHAQIAPSLARQVEAGFQRDSYEAIRVAGKQDTVTAPGLHMGGWYDIFLQDTIDSFRAMRSRGVPSKLLIGPWTHTGRLNPLGELSFGFAAQAAFIDLRIDAQALQLRWFDHWLRGQDTGVLAEPPIKLFVMGANVWRDEAEWPLQRAESTAWYLHEGARLSPAKPGDEAADRYDYDPSNPAPTLGGALLLTPELPAGPYDQRPLEARPDVLSYTSAALDADTEVTGPINVRLWAASSAPDTDFVARLIDVYPDGRAINLTDGIIRARYRSPDSTSLIDPGRAYAYDIDLWSTSNVFQAGHRIRVDVTSSSFPRWDRNVNTGHDWGTDAGMQVARQTILHDAAHPSHVVLPLIRP